MTASRREFLSSSGILIGAGLVVAACKKDEDEEGEVTATEDLMREHGVLRRALVVYREAAARLRANAASFPGDALVKTAALFRSFGEDYHEKKLEEAYIFPAVKKAGGKAASCVDVLVQQHQRGREIGDYITAQAPKIADASTLASALDGFARMYEEHAAIEDTIIFPAWKKTMSAKQLDEMGDKFEDIEKQTFGKDGFDDAVVQIEAIEESLALDDLSKFTAPPVAKT